MIGCNRVDDDQVDRADVLPRGVELVCDRALTLRHRLEHVNRSDVHNVCGTVVLGITQERQDFLRKLQTLFEFNRLAFCGVHLMEVFAFLNDSFHDGTSACHEAFKCGSIVLLASGFANSCVGVG